MEAQDISVNALIYVVVAELRRLLLPGADSFEESRLQGELRGVQRALVLLGTSFEERVRIEQLGSQVLGLVEEEAGRGDCVLEIRHLHDVGGLSYF